MPVIILSLVVFVGFSRQIFLDVLLLSVLPQWPVVFMFPCHTGLQLEEMGLHGP